MVSKKKAQSTKWEWYVVALGPSSKQEDMRVVCSRMLKAHTRKVGCYVVDLVLNKGRKDLEMEDDNKRMRAQTMM